MDFLRQFAGLMATPLVVALLAGAMAAALYRSRRRRVAGYLFLLAAMTAYLGSLDPVGNLLLAPLERQYPVLRERELPPGLRYIVVLGSSYSPGEGVPISAALDREGLARCMEGIVLARRVRAAQVVVTGGAPPGRVPPALGCAALARALGVADDAIIVLPVGVNTQGEARAIAGLVGAEVFALVTSASHMPRAMRHMERAEVRAIPVPVGHLADSSLWVGLTDLLPGSRGLRKTETALHEYLGLASLSLGIG